MGGKPKLSYEFVKQKFEDRDCKLLSTEYINHNQHLRYVASCGHKHEISYSNFQRGKGKLCRACSRKLVGKRQQLGHDAIKAYFEAEKCIVLNDDFETSTDLVRYVAQCGHENVADYAHFSTQGVGRVCSRCSKSIRYEYSFVRDYFRSQGCELLEATYVNCKTQMRYRAICGHEAHIDFDHFMNDRKYPKLCLSCLSEKIKSGELKVRRRSVEMTEWRDTVLRRDDYTCQICKSRGGRLNAHHLNCYADFPEEAFDVDNGVTLCASCHKALHGTCGYKTKKENYFWFKEIVDTVSGNTEVIAESKESATP